MAKRYGLINAKGHRAGVNVNGVSKERLIEKPKGPQEQLRFTFHDTNKGQIMTDNKTGKKYYSQNGQFPDILAQEKSGSPFTYTDTKSSPRHTSHHPTRNFISYLTQPTSLGKLHNTRRGHGVTRRSDR